MTEIIRHLKAIFPVSTGLLKHDLLQAIAKKLPKEFDFNSFPKLLAAFQDETALPFLHELGEIEKCLYSLENSKDLNDFHPDVLSINPTLSVIKTSWQGLNELINTPDKASVVPTPGEDYIIILQEPFTGRKKVRSAAPDELLAMKILVDNLDKRELAEQEQTTLASVDRAIEKAVAHGILLRPSSSLTRNRELLNPELEIPDKFLRAKVFTLQCHITQACDLHCKHCYDRSNRTSLSLEDAVRIFDQMYDFCQTRHVYGQISFSGGNPLLHPRFFDLYRAAADRGFMTAILGNPTSPEILADIIRIQKPEFFQVSLEGLKEYNDYIRGKGFFDRVFLFLDALRKADVYSMVMLTLTRENLDQVLPLAELLRDKVDLFTFNRLSMVGEGTELITPEKKEYETFLHSYLEAKSHNPCMALKDNLINIIRLSKEEELFGGCAGFGCGAAFNFVALLPDGEVHACRKFNSPIGNIHQQELTDIYNSPKAEMYRRGPSGCKGCIIRHVCGGCLAVIDSRGLDISVDRDPCCFLDSD